MTFQHGCPHHWKAPGAMYFLNLSKNLRLTLTNCDTCACLPGVTGGLVLDEAYCYKLNFYLFNKLYAV